MGKDEDKGALNGATTAGAIVACTTIPGAGPFIAGGMILLNLWGRKKIDKKYDNYESSKKPYPLIETREYSNTLEDLSQDETTRDALNNARGITRDYITEMRNINPERLANSSGLEIKFKKKVY